MKHVWIAGAVLLCVPGYVAAQEVVRLPEAKADGRAVAQRFEFASDGPAGPGWSRPDQVARVYVKESLPALFRRTVRLDGDVPERSRLTWMFTGPHAGVTVELSATRVRLMERFYDPKGLQGSGNYPEEVVRDEERPYAGHARELTVVLDAHLSVHVLVNGEEMLWAPLLFDLTREQLMFSGPRSSHEVLAGALLQEPVADAAVTVNAAKVHQTTVAFTDGRRSSVIVLNRSTEAQRLRMEWDGVTWTRMERTSFTRRMWRRKRRGGGSAAGRDCDAGELFECAVNVRVARCCCRGVRPALVRVRKSAGRALREWARFRIRAEFDRLM